MPPSFPENDFADMIFRQVKFLAELGLLGTLGMPPPDFTHNLLREF